ncbi:CGNR zinc finger domain-containing protein [Actinomadura parmotrematis]|uniref:CGNR zinc finger domain-containing protein n=1 Tax=Actinomadura parmotrematis TaxID=2864039 RepID=A0ABS7FZ07_9ACTN|nr:CGNR zinc finger domain-containing protein [Actinomadura parmotrematis]MBW8485672.1 CGNR zinc finger domain-containing protein [Actinomadura parmotrematis]
MHDSGYRSQGVAAAVALVNAATVPGADASDEALRALLRAHGFRWSELDEAGARRLRAWGRNLRPLFETGELREAVDLLNRLMLRTPMHPHLSAHDGEPLHLHFAPPSARLPDRFRATTLMRLAELLAEHGLTRTGVCAAGGCGRVYADTSRGGRRRFCSASCANRTNVAAFRSRRAGPGDI